MFRSIDRPPPNSKSLSFKERSNSQKPSKRDEVLDTNEKASSLPSSSRRSANERVFHGARLYVPFKNKIDENRSRCYVEDARDERFNCSVFSSFFFFFSQTFLFSRSKKKKILTSITFRMSSA